MKFVAFTTKAIKQVGADPFAGVVSTDRIFLVDDTKSGKLDKEKRFCAWKLDVTPCGLVGAPSDQRPALTSKDITKRNLKKLVKAAYSRGSEPTAVLRRDSYIRNLTFSQVKLLIARRVR